MRNLAFIGHSHHSITKSSNFFKRHLESRFAVDEYCVDPEDTWESNQKRLAGITLEKYDGIVLWQIDYLSSFFLRRGIPVIVCPMYDSSSTLKPVHWIAIRESLILSFSLELHWLIAKAGVDSIYIKYFPTRNSDSNESGGYNAQSNSLETSLLPAPSTPLKAFFWERLPDGHICTGNVLRLLSNLNIERLHIHQAPDPGRTASQIPEDHTTFPITTSTWFEASEEYHEHLRSADIFIAPRYSEGIGMGFLEAMSYGCCVVAHDMATHNEYINNWGNGILVNFNNSATTLNADASTIRSMGKRASKDAALLRANWENFYLPLMFSAIDDYLAGFAEKQNTNLLNNRVPLRDSELQNLFAAHNDWEKYYSWLEVLDSAKSRLQQSDYGIISSVINLEKNGDYEAALALLDEEINKQPSASIYDLFRTQLAERMVLKQKN